MGLCEEWEIQRGFGTGQPLKSLGWSFIIEVFTLEFLSG